MDRRGFFKSILGKGLSHGARQVDAVVIPFERAARAARDAMPSADPEPARDAAAAGAPAAVRDPLESVAAPPEGRRPLPAQPPATPCTLEDLMRLAADAGLIRHVEAVCALSRRTIRLVPVDGEPAGRSRLGGAPDLPPSEPWPLWDDEPLSFLGQIDLAEACAAGVDEVLPPDGLLLIFSAGPDTPTGTSPLDRESSRAIHIEPDRIPFMTPAPEGEGVPAQGRAVALSSELTLPRVWNETVRALGLDESEQAAWEQVRRELAELQGLEPWDAGGELRSQHLLLGYPEEVRGDMQLACELVARGIDVGYGAPAQHPSAEGLDGVAQRWRLLLQLTIDDDLGWRFGHGRERLYLWAPEDDLCEGVTTNVVGRAR